METRRLLPGEAADAPVGHEGGAEFAVEALGGLVPVEDGPFEAAAAPGIGELG